MKKKLMLFCLAAALAFTGTTALFAAPNDNWKTVVQKENKLTTERESGGPLGVHVGKQMERFRIQQQHKTDMKTRVEKLPENAQKAFLKGCEKVEKAFAKNPLFKGYVVTFLKPEHYRITPFDKLVRFAEGNAAPSEVDTNYHPSDNENLRIIRLFFYDGTITALHIDPKNKIVDIYIY